VWLELRDQLAVEEAQIRQLFEVHLELLAKCRAEEPNAIELSALGAFLHSFYTGIENLFRRVAVELDDEMPRGDAWHRRILRQMAEPASSRPAFISHELEERLTLYLQFRHVFRQAYSFLLQWQKMAPLVLGSEELFEQLRTEITSFSARMDEKE
jgi:hypothetical protein